MKRNLFLSLWVLACCLVVQPSQADSWLLCDRDYNEYNDRNACERRHSRCEYDSSLGCYVPRDSSNQPNRCSQSRDEYADLYSCERRHRNCEYDTRLRCYVPSREPERRCNASYNEYNDERRCEREHPQGCRYRSDIQCYVPAPKPQPTPQPTPAPMPRCNVPHDHGSYLGRGRMGFTTKAVCEHAEKANNAICEQRADGCWHPIGQ